MSDPLTGIANRRLLDQELEQICRDANKTHHPVTIGMVDVDMFKEFNDRYGHDAGDTVLRAVATRLQAQVRATDVVARLGGDEFVILLADPLPDERLAALAKDLAEAVRQPVDFLGQALTVGVSTGIARSPRDGQTLTALMRSADQAMYQAKQTRSGYAFQTAA